MFETPKTESESAQPREIVRRVNVGLVQVAIEDGKVVLIARGERGRLVSVMFTPEAILGSLRPLREAAEAAILGRELPSAPLVQPAKLAVVRGNSVVDRWLDRFASL